MWRTLLKIVAVRFVGNKLQQVVLLLMSVVERRAHMFAQSIRDEWDRVVTTLIGFVVSLICLAFSGLIATVWLVAFAWNSPDRNLILGTALVLPLIIVAGIALYLRKVWNEKLFLHHSRTQLNDDWTVLNHAMKEKPANPQE